MRSKIIKSGINTILSDIPDTFWPVFRDELTTVFSTDIYEKDELGYPAFDRFEGTCGWNKAFKHACEKTELNWLYKWYAELEWYDSDMVDGDFSKQLMKLAK